MLYNSEPITLNSTVISLGGGDMASYWRSDTVTREISIGASSSLTCVQEGFGELTRHLLPLLSDDGVLSASN